VGKCLKIAGFVVVRTDFGFVAGIEFGTGVGDVVVVDFDAVLKMDFEVVYLIVSCVDLG